MHSLLAVSFFIKWFYNKQKYFFLHLVGELLLYFCDKRFKLCETLHFWIFFSMFLLMLTPREWESHGNIFSVLYLRVLWVPIAGHKRHRAERAKRHSLHQESDIEEGRIQQLTKKTLWEVEKSLYDWSRAEIKQMYKENGGYRNR